VESQSIYGFHRLEKVREVLLLALPATSARGLIALLVDAVVSVKLLDRLDHFAFCNQGVQFRFQCLQVIHIFLLGLREIQPSLNARTTIAKKKGNSTVAEIPAKSCPGGSYSSR
jgi:hypothetical protein